MTGHEVSLVALKQFRNLISASVEYERAPRVEAAPRRRADGAGNFPLYYHPGARRFGVRDWDGGEERFGVGVHRVPEDAFSVGALHNLAQVHYAYAVSEVLRDCDVVSDDEQGEIHLPLEIQEELQNLGPNGDVEHGHRFVSHHELRVENQRSGNHHPLSLASTQFMGESGVEFLRGFEAHAAHHLESRLPLLYLGSDAVELQRLRYGVSDSDPRIECSHRVLIDHLRCPPELLERFTA